jgi:hypothetical protein
MLNIVISYMIKWFTVIKLTLNADKTNAIKSVINIYP